MVPSRSFTALAFVLRVTACALIVGGEAMVKVWFFPMKTRFSNHIFFRHTANQCDGSLRGIWIRVTNKDSCQLNPNKCDPSCRPHRSPRNGIPSGRDAPDPSVLDTSGPPCSLGPYLSLLGPGPAPPQVCTPCSQVLLAASPFLAVPPLPTPQQVPCFCQRPPLPCR